MQSIKWSLTLKGRCAKVNFRTAAVFEICKFQKPVWACLGIPDHFNQFVADQFVALIDMKLHAQN